jgi:hypothetical protein
MANEINAYLDRIEAAVGRGGLSADEGAQIKQRLIILQAVINILDILSDVTPQPEEPLPEA